MGLFKIYIVEDDTFYGNLLQYHLSLNPDYEVTLFEKAKTCLENLYKKPDVVCIDFGLPDMSGQELLSKIKSQNNEIPVVVISGQEEVAVAVDLLKSGARDYIIKDDHTKEVLWQSIIQIRENSNLKKEVETLKEQLEVKYDFKNLIGKSAGIQKVTQLITKACKTNINVSITGETGTGKEVVAKAIHFNSERKKHPMVAVNMAAIPKELLESELFGHEKGAFTGATGTKAGKFEQANKGTLFLDEIAELDLTLQAKLLRVLQEREVVRLGGNKTIKLDARIIIATHRDLKEEVKEGRFREDLYYRLIGLPIHIPALRDRENDVMLLAEYFLDQYFKENKSGKITLSKEAKSKLIKHHWPGNVRELKATVELACVLCENGQIAAEDIQINQLEKNAILPSSGLTLRQYNNEIIRQHLELYNNNVVKVAQVLDIGKSKIYNLIKSGEINK